MSWRAQGLGWGPLFSEELVQEGYRAAGCGQVPTALPPALNGPAPLHPGCSLPSLHLSPLLTNLEASV